MKAFIVLCISIMLCKNGYSTRLPAGAFATPNYIAALSPTDDFYTKISGLKIKHIERLIGRKLTLKEKIAIKLYQWRIKKNQGRLTDPVRTKKGEAALILGLVAIGSFFLPFVGFVSIPCSILAIIFGNKAKKANPDDKQGKTGALLGWITVGLIALGLILIAIILASGGIYFSFG